MAIQRWGNVALLSKIHTVYATDPVPAGTNAGLVTDVTFTPMEGEEEPREYLLPYLGHQGIELSGLYSRLEYSIDISGAGAAGDVPGWGVHLRACGFAETVTVDEMVEYELIDSNQEAIAHYYVRSGIRYAMIGCRSSVRLEYVNKRRPKFRFTSIGMHGIVPADVAMPAITLTNFQKGRACSKARTVLSLHDYAGAAESLTIDLGNQLEPRYLINDESCEIVDRKVTGSAVFQRPTLAVKNWDTIVKNETTGALSMAHGIGDGNIVELTGPAIQIGRYSEGQSQKIINNTLPLIAQPVTGLDEIKITVR